MNLQTQARTTPGDTPVLLTCAEVAAVLRCSRRAVYHYELPFKRIGGRRLLLAVADLDAFLAQAGTR